MKLFYVTTFPCSKKGLRTIHLVGAADEKNNYLEIHFNGFAVVLCSIFCVA